MTSLDFKEDKLSKITQLLVGNTFKNQFSEENVFIKAAHVNAYMLLH